MKVEEAATSRCTEAAQTGHFNREDRALILHLQRLSTEDGPGIRTTVFFKGCPLQCEWCHNPESISHKPQVHWLETRCIGCGLCVEACSSGSLNRDDGTLKRDRSLCTACGKCAGECPAGAQELLGKEVTLEELLAELVKDRVYYDKSGGGVTLSGGEPMLQPLFAANLLKALKENGINTAIDTCGLCAGSALEKVLLHTDMILYDVKEIDPGRHKELTGQDNRRILENLLLVRDHVKSHPGKVLWIRTPLIPGATASRQVIERIGAYLHNNLGGAFQRWELCAFNNLCRDKYRRLGLDWKYAETLLIRKEELAEFEAIARGSGPDPAIIFATGATRVES
jgi:pyruvate formate lyase activating enzyme